jgi:hypothetical protein
MNSCIRNDWRSGAAALNFTFSSMSVPISSEFSDSGL